MHTDHPPEQVMNHTRIIRILSVSCIALAALGLSVPSPDAAVLLTDEFNRDDVNVGENWDDQEGISGTEVEATTAGDSDGHVVFQPNQVLRSKIIPTKGYQNLTYSQTASFVGDVETSDELIIDYQTPGGALTNITTVYHPNGNVTNQTLDSGAEDTYIRIAYTSGDLFGDEQVVLDNMSLDGAAAAGRTAQDIYFNQFTDSSDLANWTLASDSGGSKSQNATTFQIRGSGTNITLSRTIDTTNFYDLALLVTGQPISLENFQGEEFFLEYSTDSGSSWTVLDSDNASRLEAFVALPPAAENNPNFMIRGRVSEMSRSDEYGRIDMVHLVGTIPEPTSALLLAFICTLAATRRRRRP